MGEVAQRALIGDRDHRAETLNNLGVLLKRFGYLEEAVTCYRRAIDCCRSNNLVSLAFPAISTGAFRFPADRAAEIAVATTVDALPSAPSLKRVIFCCFSQASARHHEQALARL